MSPLLYVLATIAAAALLWLIGLSRHRRWDPEAELRLRRHAERRAADNGRPKAEVTVTPRRRP